MEGAAKMSAPKSGRMGRKPAVKRILALGSSVTIRIFAVAVLVLGAGAGFYAGTIKKSDQINTADKASVTVDTDADQRDLADAKSRSQQLQLDADAKRRAADAKAAASRKKRADDAAAAKAKADAEKKNQQSDTPEISADCSSYSGNRAVGCTLLPASGFGKDQMKCLSPLWEKESGWSTSSENSSSGAYGIPQALPGKKMAEYGDDWKTNPATQIKWGLSYIKGRYGDPCGAWDFFQSNNWY